MLYIHPSNRISAFTLFYLLFAIFRKRSYHCLQWYLCRTCSFFVQGMKTQNDIKVVVYGFIVGQSIGSDVTPAEVLLTDALANCKVVDENPLDNLPQSLPWIKELNAIIRASYTHKKKDPLGVSSNARRLPVECLDTSR